MIETIPKGYKQTKAGVIPDDWEVGPISDIAAINPSNNTKGIEENRLVSFLPMENVSEDGKIVSLDTRRFGEVKTGYTHFIEGDILFAKITPCMENGKGAIAENLCNGIGFGSTEFHVLRPLQRTSRDFIYQITKSPEFRVEATRFFTGSAGQKRVSKDIFTHYPTPIPPLPEQTAIASILTIVDEAITTTEAIIAHTEELKRGFMQILLTRGIDEDGKIRSEETHAFKDSPIGRVPVEWDVINFSKICKKLLNGGTPSTKIHEYWEGTIPWITGADVVDQNICEIRRYITAEAVRNSATHVIEKRNLLLVTRTGVGKVAIAPFDVAISQDLTGIILNDKANVDFIFWIFNRTNNYFIRMNQGTSINGIKRNDLNNFTFGLPPKTEQTRINDVISTINDEITTNRNYHENLQTLKSGLMQELLTGRVRVPEEMRLEAPSSSSIGEAP